MSSIRNIPEMFLTTATSIILHHLLHIVHINLLQDGRSIIEWYLPNIISLIPPEDRRLLTDKMQEYCQEQVSLVLLLQEINSLESTGHH